jgi:ligand-binding sensor domain-containing protein
MLALLAALAALQTARAEPPGRFAFRSYGSEQGLENLSVVAVLQDRDGFLWVATEDGIYRYDGDRFHRYGAEEGLPSNQITALALGDDGRLWVGTNRGLALLDDGWFRLATGALPDIQIKALAPAPGGALWVATGAGLFVKRGGDFSPAPGWEPRLAATTVWADARGAVAAAQGALYTQRDGEWRPRVTVSERIDAAVRDRAGTIWARSARHLWALSGDDKLEDFSRLLPGTSDTGYLTLDQHGTIWAPTDAGILYRDDGADSEWRVLGQEQGMPASWARVAAQDREGSVWIGVTGLHRLVGRGLWRVYSEREGLPSEVVWTEWRDDQGTLYVGTDRGLARAEGGRFQLVPGTEGHAIRALAQTPDGAIWMGGSPPELLRIKKGIVVRFGAEAGLAGRKVLSLLATRHGELLAGSDGGGLLRFDGERFVPVALPGGSVQERFSQIIEDRAGRVWAAGELGLAVRRQGEWSRLTTADGLRDERTSYLLERRSGDICVAYRESLGYSCFQPTPEGLRNLVHVGALSGAHPETAVAILATAVSGWAPDRAPTSSTRTASSTSARRAAWPATTATRPHFSPTPTATSGWAPRPGWGASPARAMSGRLIRRGPPSSRPSWAGPASSALRSPAPAAGPSRRSPNAIRCWKCTSPGSPSSTRRGCNIKSGCCRSSRSSTRPSGAKRATPRSPPGATTSRCGRGCRRASGASPPASSSSSCRAGGRRPGSASSTAPPPRWPWPRW